MKKFPKLKLCLAHLGFMTCEEANGYLESWENTSFDLTPAAEWCQSVTENYDEWKVFFTKYAEKLYFGTDTYNNIEGKDDADGYERSCARYNVARRMLEKKSDELIDSGSKLGVFKPLGLSRELLERIYYKNSRELLGNPKKMNVDLFILEACELKKKYLSGDFDFMPMHEIEEEILYLDDMIQKIKN